LKIFLIILLIVILASLLWFLPTIIRAYQEYQSVLKLGAGSIDGGLR
jgi:hypothetical protein